MAYFGGTYNPLDVQSGNTKGYDPTKVSYCEFVAPSYHDLGDGAHYYTNNDPGEANLAGYAFLAEDASQLVNALKTITGFIKEKTYSFNAPTIPAVRMTDKDIIYLSSFTPKATPFWEGSLKSYQLEADGTLKVDDKGKPINSAIWTESFPKSRKIWTYGQKGFIEFNSTNLTKEDLDVITDLERDALISYIRSLKLGDILHSSPVIVGAPSRFFDDEGFSGIGGFYESKKDRQKVIIAGANDGMLHAFNADTGFEEWAFIPNSLLKNLKLMTLSHNYYVDSSPKVADVWFDMDGDGKKAANEWKTVLVCGLRKGGKTFFALDITDTKKPEYLWEFPKSTDAVTLAKVGQSWSEPVIGRIGSKVVEKWEKWVAFIGGGFDPSETIDKDALIGKAFFVIDMKTGEILKEFSGLDGMTHAFAASPTAVDTNADGYIDKVYISDLGGQMWVFDVSNQNKDKWTEKRLFKAPREAAEKHQIFYQPAVAFDQYGTPWVFFGTGDREDPQNKNSMERFYAVKDDNEKEKYPYEEKDLHNVTKENTFMQYPKEKGWYIKLDKSEKVLAKPTVFNKLLYFTTYLPTATSADPCVVGGEGRLYIAEYLSGGGAFAVDAMSDLAGKASERYKKIGAGIPSAPIVSINSKGQATLFYGLSGAQLSSTEIFSLISNKEMLYWREVTP
jgi:type IV pilus assembly protein PilY1